MAQRRGVQVSRDVAVRLCKEHFLLELLLAGVPWQGGECCSRGFFWELCSVGPGMLQEGVKDLGRSRSLTRK